MTARSSSVSLPHFSLTLPPNCFQLPSMRFQSRLTLVVPRAQRIPMESTSTTVTQMPVANIFIEVLASRLLNMEAGAIVRRIADHSLQRHHLLGKAIGQWVAKLLKARACRRETI